MITLSTTEAEAAVHSVLNGVLSTATHDTAFRERLKSDPVTVLREAGLSIPSTITVTVKDAIPGETSELSTSNRLVLSLPPAANRNLSDEDLDKVAGGGFLHGVFHALAIPHELVVGLLSGQNVADVAKNQAQNTEAAWNNKNTW